MPVLVDGVIVKSTQPQIGCAQADDRGVSLVEVMVAMLVFTIGSLALLAAFTSALDTTSDSQLRVAAANLAASDIDEARALSYAVLATTTAKTVTVSGRSYTVSRSVTPALASGSGSACTAGGSSQQLYKKVSTKVDTLFRENVTSVRADTLVTAPAFDPASTAGALGASVINRDGQPVAGAGVLLNGVTTLTDETGCAFVDTVTPGTYPVVASKSGYIDVTGASSVSTSTGFTAGQITNQQFLIDLPARINLVPSVLNASGTLLSGYTLPGSLLARLDTPDRGTLTKTSLTPASVVTNGATLSWNAFPAVAGYEAYLGTCATGATVPSQRSTTATQVMPLVPVDVSIVGLPKQISGERVQAVSGVSGCSETLIFPVTTASDGKAKVAIPPGSWTLSIVGRALTARAVVLTAQTPSAQMWIATW